MTLVIEILSWVLLVTGAGFMLLSALGMIRLPDFFTRLHGASLADTGGAALMLLGMMLQAGFTLVTVKLILIGVFLFFTSPTATHALAHAALIGGLSPDKPAENQKSDDAPGA
jgi:multicomponent Na+:H+ antiporter subunit G